MTTAPKILIVEDEPTLADIFRDYLLAEGFEVDVKYSGEGVVESVQQSPPDLVLLDRMLPVQDGLSICKAIRQFSVVPIILITAKTDELDRIQGLDGGADDYVCKPASPKEVVSRVKALLRRSAINYSLSTGDNPTFADIASIGESGVRSLELTEEESQILEILSSSQTHSANAAELQQAFSHTQTLDQIIAKTEILSHKLAIVWQVENPVRYNDNGIFELTF